MKDNSTVILLLVCFAVFAFLGVVEFNYVSTKEYKICTEKCKPYKLENYDKQKCICNNKKFEVEINNETYKEERPVDEDN